MIRQGWRFCNPGRKGTHTISRPPKLCVRADFRDNGIAAARAAERNDSRLVR